VAGHGPSRKVGFARPQSFYDGVVVPLVGTAVFGGVTPSLQVAPHLVLASNLDGAVHTYKESIVRGDDEGVVQSEVPRLELVASLRSVTADQATLHFVEVPACGGLSGQASHAGLKEPPHDH